MTIDTRAIRRQARIAANDARMQRHRAWRLRVAALTARLQRRAQQ